MKMLKQSPAASSLQTTPHVGIWRSQLTAQLCVDFWLNMPAQDNTVSLDSNKMADLGQEIFPRVFVKEDGISCLICRQVGFKR